MVDGQPPPERREVTHDPSMRPAPGGPIEDRRQRAIAHLNRFLADEQAAVESYARTHPCAGHDASPDWTICLMSHRRQATLIAQRIKHLGGHPTTACEPWPAVTQSLDQPPGSLSTRKALRAGEDRGLAGYLSRMPDLDDDSRLLVEQELRPAQFRTHEAARRICAAEWAEKHSP